MNKTNKYLFIPLGLLSMTALSGALLMSNSVNADNDSVVDEINITVPVSCTLSGSGMTSHTASIPNGTYTPDIGTTTLTAFCNDNAGFSIYAAGYTGDEIGGTNSTKLVGTSASNNATIDTGTNAGPVSGNDTSNWAMKLTAVSSPTPTYPITITSDTSGSFSSYHAVPSEYTKVATRTSGTDIGQSAEGSTLTTTYAAYISKTQAADTYTGQVIYTLVHPYDADPIPPEPITCSPYEICYSSNAYNAIGTMGVETDIEYDGDTDGFKISLLPSNYSRKGYGFAGWNDKYDYSGTNYGPMETITIPMDETTFGDAGLSLYAVWVESAGSIQNWQGCSSLSEGQVTALTDERNDETYAIAKLADGKCWMIENLRLDGSATLSSQNTNNPSLPMRIINTDGSISTANNLSPTYTSSWNPHMYMSDNIWDDWALSLLYTGATTNRATSPSSVDYNEFYSYGNYYNWYSATAANDRNDEKGNNESTEGDICPAGWRLPIGGNASNISNSDFAELNIALGGTGTNSDSNTNPTSNIMALRYRAYPNNFVYAGYFNDQNNWLGEKGEYWTSTTGSYKAVGYLFSVHNNYIYPGTNVGNKGTGNSIRCITE